VTQETPRAGSGFGPFFLNGEWWRLDEDPAVRARDLENGAATLVHPETGRTLVLHASALQLPPLPGLDPIPDEDCYDLRSLIEEILSLGLDTAQAQVVMGLVTRRRMLREPKPT
jgi:hypothetical protein